MGGVQLPLKISTSYYLSCISSPHPSPSISSAASLSSSDSHQPNDSIHNQIKKKKKKNKNKKTLLLKSRWPFFTISNPTTVHGQHSDPITSTAGGSAPPVPDKNTNDGNGFESFHISCADDDELFEIKLDAPEYSKSESCSYSHDVPTLDMHAKDKQPAVIDDNGDKEDDGKEEQEEEEERKWLEMITTASGIAPAERKPSRNLIVGRPDHQALQPFGVVIRRSMRAIVGSERVLTMVMEMKFQRRRLLQSAKRVAAGVNSKVVRAVKDKYCCKEEALWNKKIMVGRRSRELQLDDRPSTS